MQQTLYLPPGYTWKAGLKSTKIVPKKVQEGVSFTIFEDGIIKHKYETAYALEANWCFMGFATNGKTNFPFYQERNNFGIF